MTCIDQVPPKSTHNGYKPFQIETLPHCPRFQGSLLRIPSPLLHFTISLHTKGYFCFFFPPQQTILALVEAVKHRANEYEGQCIQERWTCHFWAFQLDWARKERRLVGEMEVTGE